MLETKNAVGACCRSEVGTEDVTTEKVAFRAEVPKAMTL